MKDDTVTMTLSAKVAQIWVGCLICGEPVPVDHFCASTTRVCDKCKRAVTHVRQKLERDPCKPILDIEENGND